MAGSSTAPAAVVPALGVGLAYQEALQGFLAGHADRYDYVEVVPEVVRVDAGPGRTPRLREDPDKWAFLCDLGQTRQVIPHSIGLSIGSAHGFNAQRIAHLRDWYDVFRFPWHSDHLAFSLAQDAAGSGEINAGLMLPVTYDEPTLERIAGRIRQIHELVPAPFALENNVDYIRVGHADYDEPQFHRLLCGRSGGHLLLDLHNLYANSRNHGFDPFEELAAFPLEHVIELHVAGGFEYDGHYLDAHSGPVPEVVWELLAAALPGCVNAGGVTFEIVGSWYPSVGAARLVDELDRLRSVWASCRGVPVPT